MQDQKIIGRVISSSSSECVVSFVADRNEIPVFGSMVRIPGTVDIYGLVTDVQFEGDGFLQQIAGSASISPEVILDAQTNRNVPIVLRILFLGYREEDRILHLLPPCPPVTLTEIYPCTDREICAFTRKLGYLRMIRSARNVIPAELFASHIRVAARAHAALGDPEWIPAAMDELIDLFYEDPTGLTAVLSAVGDADIC